MIKVVHLITGLGPGGAENQLTQLVTLSDTTRFKHVVISMQDKGRWGSKIEAQGIPVYTLDMKIRWIACIKLFRLLKILKQEKPDILQTWLYHADGIGLLMGKLLGIRRIIWNIRCANLDLKRYSRMTAYMIKLCCYLSGFPTAVIVNSKMGQKIHDSLGYRVKQWSWIPNGFHTERFKPDPNMRRMIRQSFQISEDHILIGMIARYDPMKDHASFLLAARSILNRFPNVRFMLVGWGVDATNTQLMQDIKQQALEDSVFLLGVRTDIPALLTSLDLCVLSSFAEGFPNVLGEAMATGVPCVATDVGDCHLIVGATGKIVQPSNVPALAGAVGELLELDTSTRRQLGDLARERIKTFYCISEVVRQYESLYEAYCGLRK